MRCSIVRIFSIFAITLVIASPQAFAAKVVGTLMVVKGKVYVLKKGKKKKRARVGTKIRAKDTIITEKDSRAKAVMMDKNIIHISPKSKMTFEKYVFSKGGKKKNVLLNVLYGKVRSNVKQKYDGKKNRFQVKTKAAVAGVRGTDFLASYSASSGQSQFVTFKGMVAVGKAGAGGTITNAVTVAPGQMTTAAAGSPPGTPKTMSKKALASMDAESGGGPPGPERKTAGSEGGGEESNDEEGGDSESEGGGEGDGPDEGGDAEGGEKKEGDGPDEGGGESDGERGPDGEEGGEAGEPKEGGQEGDSERGPDSEGGGDGDGPGPGDGDGPQPKPSSGDGPQPKPSSGDGPGDGPGPGIGGDGPGGPGPGIGGDGIGIGIGPGDGFGIGIGPGDGFGIGIGPGDGIGIGPLPPPAIGDQPPPTLDPCVINPALCTNTPIIPPGPTKLKIIINN